MPVVLLILMFMFLGLRNQAQIDYILIDVPYRYMNINYISIFVLLMLHDIKVYIESILLLYVFYALALLSSWRT